MIVGVVDQSDTVDNAIPARNVNQGFLVTFTPPLQAAIVFRRVVDRPLTGQREALFGRQEVLAAEPDGRPLLDVDGFVFGEREIFRRYGGEVYIGSHGDFGNGRIGQCSGQILCVIDFHGNARLSSCRNDFVGAVRCGSCTYFYSRGTLCNEILDRIFRH